MFPELQPASEELLGQSAKAFAVTYLRLDARSWNLTSNQAWVRFVEQLLKARGRATSKPVQRAARNTRRGGQPTR